MNEFTSSETLAGEPSSPTFSERFKNQVPVVEHPLPYILGAFALGIAVAFLIPTHEPTLRERYVDEPLDEVKSMLKRLMATASKNAQNVSDDATSRAKSAAEKVKSFWGNC